MNAVKNKSNMLDRAKRNFLRMASPGEFGADRVDGLDSPAFVNIPVEIAERDAAYSKAVDILNDGLFPRNSADRVKKLRHVEALLGVAVEKTELVYNISIKEKKQLESKCVLEYLKLAELLAGTAADLDGVRPLVNGANAELSDFTGVAEATAEGGFDNGFSDLAVKTLDFLLSLAKSSDKRMRDVRNSIRKLFSKSDAGRYDKAYAAFSDRVHQRRSRAAENQHAGE